MRNGQSASEIGSIDKLLLSLDGPVFGALYRVVIGFVTIPAMQLTLGSEGSDWRLVPFLLGVLLLLRVAPAIARKLLPFSAELRDAWSVRRRTAKLYDSFQWRKLTWFGAGIALYVAASGRYRPVEVALSMFCLVTGAWASVRWRSVNADSRHPKPVARRIKRITA